MTRRRRALGVLAGLLAVAVPAPAPALASGLTADEDAATLRLSSHGRTLEIAKSPWRLRVLDAAGRPIVSEAAATAAESMPNADRAPFADTYMGIDLAYPGLPTVSYQPLAFRRGGAWAHVSALRSFALEDGAARLAVDTSDGATGEVRLSIEPDGAVRVAFRPAADPARGAVDAVAEAFDAPVTERYVGGGQRFGAFDQRGRSVPLWISHGVGADRFGSTNESAVPFLLSTGGWALELESVARGELNAGVPGERPDALGATLEDDELVYRIHSGTPAAMLAGYTARAGRPDPPPPEWAYEPAYWMDEGNTQAAIEAFAQRLAAEDLPAGAFWIDNPWEAHKGDFGPDPKRFPDFDALLGRLRARGIHTVAWASPYVDPGSALGPAVAAGHHLVEDASDDDATYLPPRGNDPHLDFTDADGVGLYEGAAAALIARGVDGFKADRGEEDLGEASKWADGRPNRLQHNAYPGRYQAALRRGCARGGEPDCFIVGRGGAAGAQRAAAAWAGDNVSAPGAAGLGQALRSLLSLSMSGQPISGSDIGGYVGTREATGEGFPTKELYLRWAQLGALSPIMQTPHAPWEFGDAPTVAAFRRFAAFHAALAPSLARWGREAAQTGMPIVRPLLLAFPDDPVAARIDDEYLLGPDLLVAPITETASATDSRSVYFPAGKWRDLFTDEVVEGPTARTVTVALDRMPLYARVGGSVPEQAVQELRAPETESGPEPGPGSGGPAALGSDTPAAPGRSGCRDTAAPRVSVTRPRRLRARGLRLVRGRATDLGCARSGVAQVLVAVAFQRAGRCAWAGPRGRLGRPRACRRARYVRAAGGERWARRLPRRLPRGRYRIRVRTADRAGNVSARDASRAVRLR